MSWLHVLLYLAGGALVTLTGFVLYCRAMLFRAPSLKARRKGLSPQPPVIVGFFHPYCNSGGGGERVLWCALRALEAMHEAAGAGAQPLRAVVYTGDVGVEAAAMIARAKDRFGVTLSGALPLEFVVLRRRHLVEAAAYPHFTMIGQSLGSMALAWEALRQLTPHVFVDTTGYAFTFCVARWLAKCRVAAYVHYPTISTDMLQACRERRPAHNNDEAVAASPLKSRVKLLYYQLFATLYGAVGALAHVVMVNSNWTRAHIEALWRRCPAPPAVVFPPCDTATLARQPLEPREPLIVSVAQFRPEKDHSLQLRAFAMLKALGRTGGANVSAADAACIAAAKLALVGSCRGADDEARVEALRAECAALTLGEDAVSFHLNVSFGELQGFLGRGIAGLHTMWNEHFGIGVVEMQAAGLVTIAHNSGGPKEDIVTPYHGSPTGFLAATVEEYCDAMRQAVCSPDGLKALRQNARDSTPRFSDEVFHNEFQCAFRPVLAGLGSAAAAVGAVKRD